MLQAGDIVELISEPQLYFGKPDWLKVGGRYTFRYYDGCCVCVANPLDPKGIGCHFNKDRVRKIS